MGYYIACLALLTEEETPAHNLINKYCFSVYQMYSKQIVFTILETPSD